MNCSSNMLYPKEDPDTHRLQFACRTCQFSEEATSSCVFRNVLNNAVGETAGVTQDVGSDPTVSLPIFHTYQSSSLFA
jgi:DNA-directed RNA polymerase II subunit RPB9